MLDSNDITNILAIQQESPKYKPKSGRFNPFELEKIKFSVVSKEYSNLINRYIESVEDAVWHAKLLTEKWATEDNIERKERKRIQNLKRQQRFQAKKKAQLNPKVKEAFELLQSAIQQRKSAIAEWDKYVEQLRHNYTMLKAENDQSK